MTTLTVFGDTADGAVESSDATYSTMRSGSGLSAFTVTTTWIVGQQTGYVGDQIFLAFDTSPLGAGATITSAVLSLYGSENASATDFDVQARLLDWGTTVTTADWVAGASLSGLTLLGSFNTSAYSLEAYNAFSDTAMTANINKTGFTRMVIASSRLSNGDVPTGNEYVGFYLANEAGTTKDPKLVITYTTPAGGARPRKTRIWRQFR